MKSFVFPEFQIIRDEAKCGQCRGCERQCAFGTHTYDPVSRSVDIRRLQVRRVPEMCHLLPQGRHSGQAYAVILPGECLVVS